ncbi:hypothetical protein GCM10010335_59650 [Streptomyces galbus]|nr:hypothetical protein GCM10010335_59650 [Streptomyces galbus]
MHDVAGSWTTVGWESAPLRDVSAVRHRRIVSLDYADLVESPRNPSAIARLGAYLRGVPSAPR